MTHIVSIRTLNGSYTIHEDTNMQKDIKFEEVQDAVVEWAEKRGITSQAPRLQLLKTMEELGELCAAVLRKDKEGEVDAIGDVLVTLIIYCEMQNLDITRCLLRAYNEIAGREGAIVDGVFVKA
jgi:NTP pyrophosphatase (non-canonical NTP hydrolase)